MNLANEDACAKGGRQPAFSAGLDKLNVAKVAEIWNLWISFTAQYDNAKESRCWSRATGAKRSVR